MKLTCAREDLVEKLGVVARGVSSRMAVQILSGILLKTEGGELHLAATDMELSLRAALPADVETEGATVVPGRLLLELARLLPESEVTIEHSAEEGSVSVVCGSASYRLHTYDAADFPRLPEAGDSAMSSIDREAFLETVGRVSRSASRDESRPVLTGILVRFEQGKLVMAATDSYRLSVKETSLDSDIGELEAIVPARALNEVARVAQGVDQLQLGMSDNQAIFEADGVVLTTRRIDGQFPNYGQLLPESFEHEVAVPREELLEVVRRISVMAQRNSPLRLSFADGELTVSAQTQDVGSASESLAAAFQGEPLVIGFNAEFLRDGIESVADDELRMKLISPLRPCVLQGAGDDFTYLIMPIRLAG
jgi:DNA polymerase-3 subunit beta